MSVFLRAPFARSGPVRTGETFLPLLFGGPAVIYGANCLILALAARDVSPATFGALATVVALLVLFSLPAAVARTMLAGWGADPARRFDGRAGLSVTSLRGWLRLFVAVSLAVAVVDPVVARVFGVGVGTGLSLGLYAFASMVAAVPQALLTRQSRPGAVRAVVGFSFACRVAAGVTLLRPNPSVSLLLSSNLIGEVAAFGLGVFLVVRGRRASVSPKAIDLRPSIPEFARILLAPAGIWTLAFADVVLARRYLSAAAAGSYAAASLAARLLVFVPLLLHDRRSKRPGRTPIAAHPGGSMTTMLELTGLVLLLAVPLIALVHGRAVAFVFGSHLHPVGLLLPLLIASAACLAACVVLATFHLAVGSRAHYMALFLVGLEVGHGMTWHLSSDLLATIALATAALLLLFLLEALYAIWRWEPQLSKLNEHREVDRLVEMAEGPIELSVVVPCYNAGPELEEHLERLDRQLATGGPYELIVVSDGSTDETVSVAAASLSPAVRVLHYEVNRGKGHALRVGLANARGTYIAFIDADGDIDPEALGPFLSLMKLYTPDIVLGSKRHPLSDVTYPPLRRVMSWTYHKLTRLLFRVNVRDTQTGVKLIRRDVLAAVLPLMLEKRYAFDLEFLVVARMLGFVRVFEAPIRLDFRFRSRVDAEAVLRIVLDTVAIFYRRYILNTYRRLQDSGLQGTPARPVPTDRPSGPPVAAETA
jgi:hypothetical protein